MPTIEKCIGVLDHVQNTLAEQNIRIVQVKSLGPSKDDEKVAMTLSLEIPMPSDQLSIPFGQEPESEEEDEDGMRPGDPF